MPNSNVDHHPGMQKDKRSRQFSMLTLLLMMIVAVFLAWCAQLAFVHKTPWATAVSGLALFIGILFTLYCVTFCIIFPIGLLEEYAEKAIEAPTSPFATHRLPEQFVNPEEGNTLS